jgi:hypothetical protein
VVHILVRHGGGEGGHYFSAQAVQIWRQMSQVMLQYPYAGVDFRGDPDMVLPPGEVFDHRGMLCIYICFDLCCDFDIPVHMYDVWILIPSVVACLVHVQIWHLAGVRWSYIDRRCSESESDLRVERGGRWDEVVGGTSRAQRDRRRRHRFDDPGAGPSHAPPVAAEGDLDDIRHRFETVFRDVPEGMWICIQDEGVLGVVYRSYRHHGGLSVRRAVVLAAMTSGRLPPGQEGPMQVRPPPPPGAGGGGPPPPPEGGVARGVIKAP